MLSNRQILNEISINYTCILKSPCFEVYEEYSEVINKLYSLLEQRSITDEDKLKLKEIKNMHDEIMQALESEKKTLEKQIVAIEKKKNASNVYNKQASYINDAFFVDIKN
ncbi:hypothetical protein [Paenibacillus sp. FJAT-26967]|uniref:hypothetical protein n=1 Tax=Paenibacillus sp. FJAT-26967 TaxID=1729690 RepID=UPI0008399A79|nr:hypothetical protein [Paenibacillus sp. FJAT-26967]